MKFVSRQFNWEYLISPTFRKMNFFPLEIVAFIGTMYKPLGGKTQLKIHNPNHDALHISNYFLSNVNISGSDLAAN